MRRTPLFWKLFPSYLLVTVLSLLVAGLAVRRELREHETERSVALLADTAKVFAAAAHSIEPGQLGDFCRRAGELAGTRFTVIAADGAVLADSQADPAGMENHADRYEVRQALDGKTGIGVRRSPTLGRDMLYVAYLDPQARGGPTVFRAAEPLKDFESRLGGHAGLPGRGALRRGPGRGRLRPVGQPAPEPPPGAPAPGRGAHRRRRPGDAPAARRHRGSGPGGPGRQPYGRRPFPAHPDHPAPAEPPAGHPSGHGRPRAGRGPRGPRDLRQPGRPGTLRPAGPAPGRPPYPGSDLEHGPARLHRKGPALRGKPGDRDRLEPRRGPLLPGPQRPPCATAPGPWTAPWPCWPR